MRVVVYPADTTGCGYHRLIWPSERLIELGHRVDVVLPQDRKMSLTVEGDRVIDADVPDADVVVFQRTTHRFVAKAVGFFRERGVTTIVDVDDDLETIHPSNPAWSAIHPKNENRRQRGGRTNMHSWLHLREACQLASMVTVSTPALLARYAPHGRGRVLHNYVADHYVNVRRDDDADDAGAVVGWPASFFSHPNDPEAVGPAFARLVNEGVDFQMIGDPRGAGRAFGLDADPPGRPVELLNYPGALTRLRVGIAPLADTRFNEAKSWLKPLELSAVGVPWVASPRAEYTRLHREYGAGVLAERPRDWYRQVKRLLDDPGRRREVTEAGLAAAERLRLRDHAWRWWEAWAEARQADLARGLPHVSPLLRQTPRAGASGTIQAPTRLDVGRLTGSL